MLLGVAWIAAVLPVTLGWSAAAVVAGHVAYVTGLTIAARREADLSQSRGRLTLGWGICAFPGPPHCRISPRLEMDRTYRLDQNGFFPCSLAILLSPLARRAVDAIRDSPSATTRHGNPAGDLQHPIPRCDGCTSDEGDIPGIIIASMVVPTLLLARWFRATDPGCRDARGFASCNLGAAHAHRDKARCSANGMM
jgi:hypothetical protein